LSDTSLKKGACIKSYVKRGVGKIWRSGGIEADAGY